jgi:hypothetical protein
VSFENLLPSCHHRLAPGTREKDAHARSRRHLTITDSEAAERALHEQLCLACLRPPGSSPGTGTTKGSTALSIFVFETERAATQISEQAAAGVPYGAVLDAIDVREVVAYA